MSAETGEQLRTRFQSIQQVKWPDGAARAVRYLAVAGDDKRRPAVALDHARGRDADDAAVPAIAVNHHAEGIAQSGVFFNASLNSLHDSPLFFLPLGVELV